MINITEAETLIKTLQVEYCSEAISGGGFKFSMRLSKEPERLFLITIAEFSDRPEWECVYSLFLNRKIVMSNGGNFINAIEGLKRFIELSIAC